MSGNENVVQMAIVAALQVYCEQPGMPRLELFPPLSVQQGDSLRKFCADLIARLDNSKVILLEVKEFDCNTKTLKEFKAEQHLEYLRFEELGVPVGYAYNVVWPLPYNHDQRPQGWPKLTLEAVNHSLPTLLPGKSPAMSEHPTLLDWFNRVRGEDVSEQMGRIHGAIKGAHNLRNGALVLLHSVDEDVLMSLTAEQLEKALKLLGSSSWLSPQLDAKLKKILGASAGVLSDFRKRPVSKSAARKAGTDLGNRTP
ncbi:hypothetical protein ACEI36_07375 [Pseudomonas kielensis]|uniref:hypothetical protein n=1 Tax=Pseudomonas kielensis TaxID=2762577 RepID=UPI00389C3370